MANKNLRKVIVALLLTIIPCSLMASKDNQPTELGHFIQTNALAHQKMQQGISSNKADIQNLQKELNLSQQKVDSLEKRIDKLQKEIEADKKASQEQMDKASTSIQTLRGSVKDKVIFGGIALALVIIVLIATIAFLKKKLSTLTSSLEEAQNIQKDLQDSQKLIEDGTATLDEKVVDLLEKQIASSQQQTSQDHSLALKVADEIVRIETNLYRMDPATRGYKQLTRSIQRMKDCFMTKGYEISDMLGKPYNEGMKVVANFVIDESLPAGSAIISGLIKPQIIFNGKMIQAAQITVSQNI